MASFEEGFADVERASDSLARSADGLTKAAKQLRRAAQDGDIATIRRGADRLAAALDTVRQEAANAQQAWPFSAEAEDAYLREEYEAELLREAQSQQLAVTEADGRLLAFPSVVRIQPGDRSLKVDKKRWAGIRPSRVVRLLRNAQTRKASFAPERFLVTLRAAYDLVRKDDSGTPEVSLNKIYNALVIHPAAKADYGLGDFKRDLFLLDQSGLRETRDGKRFGLSAATSTRGPDRLELVAPSGETRIYSKIWFE